jgi:hypothetical protein
LEDHWKRLRPVRAANPHGLVVLSNSHAAPVELQFVQPERPEVALCFRAV